VGMAIFIPLATDYKPGLPPFPLASQ
jgi:hypothetical protein